MLHLEYAINSYQEVGYSGRGSWQFGVTEIAELASDEK